MVRNIKRISSVLFCIYILAVTALCLIHTDNMPELPRSIFGIPLDKVVHFIMFLPFMILGYSTFHPINKSLFRKLAVLGILFILGCTFALATERLQAMTTYRSYELTDLTADCSAIAVGTLIILAYIIKTHK